MKFVIGFIATYISFWVMSWLGEHQSKPAKNYQELMKRDAFKMKGKYDE